MSRPVTNEQATHPALLERWRSERATLCAGNPANQTDPLKPVGVPLAQQPRVKQLALTRYRDDEVAAIKAAAARPKPTRGVDERFLLGCGRFLFRAYEMLRSFIVHHIGGFVPKAVRYARLQDCRACSFRRDRGDGVTFCVKRQEWCACPAWLLACLFWLTWLRSFACPIGRFKKWSPRDAKPLGLPVKKTGCGGAH